MALVATNPRPRPWTVRHTRTKSRWDDIAGTNQLYLAFATAFLLAVPALKTALLLAVPTLKTALLLALPAVKTAVGCVPVKNLQRTHAGDARNTRSRDRMASRGPPCDWPPPAERRRTQKECVFPGI